MLVWDNASEGSDDIRALAATLPHIAWTFSPTNIGFAPAVNRLAEQVSGDLLLLNPDAVLLGPLVGDPPTGRRARRGRRRTVHHR